MCKNQLNEALNNVTPQNWEKVIIHTEKVEQSFRKIDFGGDKAPIVEPVIIDIGESESYSESEDYSDNSIF